MNAKGEGYGCIRELGITGDAVLAEYSLDDKASLMAARSVFDELVASGLAAFGRALGDTANDAVQLHSFEPMDEILIIRPVRGGSWSSLPDSYRQSVAIHASR